MVNIVDQAIILFIFHNFRDKIGGFDHSFFFV